MVKRPKRRIKKEIIYLDYAATTPLDPDVLKVMMPYLGEEYGNPSSVHQLGQRALAAIDEAREKLAKFLGCELREVIFTGSATEANNLAIQGIVKNYKSQITNYEQSTTAKSQILNPHIITSQIEHDSVLECCRALEKEGVEVTYLSVTKDGFVRIEDVKNALKDNTVLISIMYANNEVGTIQPIAEIANSIHDFRKHKIQIPNHKQDTNIYPLFHTDAVQAANYLDCDVNKLGVDLLTLSAHKIYGPKGVGALYVRSGTPLEPLIRGGGQEFALRPGTENVTAIAGFGAAIQQITNYKTQNINSKIQKLRDRLIKEVLKSIPNARLNGSRENRLPNNANFCFPGVSAETLTIALDQEGIAISSGSACSSRAMQPSHTLLAIGLSEDEANSSVRVTLGKYTTEQEITRFFRTLTLILKRLKYINSKAPKIPLNKN